MSESDNFAQVDQLIIKLKSELLMRYNDKVIEDETIPLIEQRLAQWSVWVKKQFANLELVEASLLTLERPMLTIVYHYQVKGYRVVRDGFRIAMRDKETVKPLLQMTGSQTPTITIPKELFQDWLRKIVNKEGFANHPIDAVQLCLTNGMVINDVPEINILVSNQPFEDTASNED